MKNKENSQPGIEQIIRETTEETQSKTDRTKAWSTKYPILKTYQAGVNIPHYARRIRLMLELKDIPAHEYMDKKGK